MMRAIAIVLVASFLASTSAFAQDLSTDLSAEAQSAKVEADAWRKVADSIPLGSKVKIQTYEGKRINGTLMRVDGNQILVKRNTRRPEPAVTVMFDDMSKLERDQNGGGSNLAKAAVIGLATGAGVIFSLFLIALQFD
jgi:hypothetical protein